MRPAHSGPYKKDDMMNSSGSIPQNDPETVEALKAELNRLRAQLLRDRDQRILGDIAHGIAHELNNPLTPVLTYPVLMKMKLARMPENIQAELKDFTDFLDLISEGGRRCKSIVDNIFSFSRPAEGMAPVYLEDVIDKTFELIGVKLRHQRIRLTRNIEKNLPPVHGVRVQIQKALSHIILNSIQAMADGGEMTISVRNQDRVCEISIADTGPGVAEDIASQIFEPFFSAWPEKRAGLGLAAAQEIIKAHHGEIRVHSHPGQSAEFIIRLPIAR
jgi:signal transduction histidine kinase